MPTPSYFANFSQMVAKGLDQLRQDFMSLRTNRATPAMLERIRVSTYGSEMPINQVASIGVLDNRTLEIRAWDPQVLPEIEKAILKSDLGVTPVADGNVLRLSLPLLTEERRKELAKIAKKYAEDGRVRIRAARRDAQEEAIARVFKEKKITEDEKFRRQHELDALTNKYIVDIDQLLAAKEKEIFEI